MTFRSVLVEVLREEIASRDGELEALRDSARYRIGGWVLEAWPPGPKSVGVFFKLLRFYLRRRAKVAGHAEADRSLELDETAQQASVIVFGREHPEPIGEDVVWRSADAALVARRLDLGGASGTLIVRNLDEQVLRRVERLRRDRWYVIWDPEMEAATADPALVTYMRAHADLCRERIRT